MASKHPPAEKVSSETLSKGSPPLPDQGKDNEATTNNRDNQRSSNGRPDDESSTTNATEPTVVSGSPKDIICGRGLHIMNHHGNFNLHLIVERYRHTYLRSTRRQKAAIAQHIIKEMKSTGARFLRRFKEDGDDSDDKWVEVDDKTAYKKVSHALRLRKSDHGQAFNSVVHRPQTEEENPHSGTMSSMSRGAASISQDAAAMKGGPQNTMSHESRVSSSSSLPLQLPLQFSVAANQLQAVPTPPAPPPALPPDIATQHPSTIPLHVANGYGNNIVIDPQLYAETYRITLATLRHQLQHQQHSSTFNSNSIDDQRAGRSSNEERRGYY